MDLAPVFDQHFAAGRTAFRRLSSEGVHSEHLGGRSVLCVAPDTLRLLAREAFRDVNFFLRTQQLEQWAAMLDDPTASEPDRLVAAALLKNAAISAAGALPICQDTGTATVLACKGEDVFTGGGDGEALEAGIRQAYTQHHLRCSQVAPLSMFEERNTGCNLPAQIDIHAAAGSQYQFLFLAKGGGSANKTAFFSETKALLNEQALGRFLAEKVRNLGVAACPPYHLALVVGGTSPEFNLTLLKLATAGALDYLPRQADGNGTPYRDEAWEARLLAIAADTRLGAQFGGKYLGLDARVIRCARHGGSCPVSLGVSCSAHRNAWARICSDGVFLEDFDRQPDRFSPRAQAVLQRVVGRDTTRHVRLDRPVDEICRELAGYAVGTLVLLSGPLIVARDAAHARFQQLLRAGRPLPDYLRLHPIYYAGPAETPPGHVIGSFGPTTAQRMDVYLAELMAHGASRITLAKGNRAPGVTAACREHGGFYLATIGGAAALLAREHIVQSQIIDYADLGMEAVRRIEVQDLPALVIVDDKGNNLYEQVANS